MESTIEANGSRYYVRFVWDGHTAFVEANLIERAFGSFGVGRAFLGFYVTASGRRSGSGLPGFIFFRLYRVSWEFGFLRVYRDYTGVYVEELPSRHPNSSRAWGILRQALGIPEDGRYHQDKHGNGWHEGVD